MVRIDLDQLRVGIRKLHRSQALYRVLKEELTKLGYWKLRARGDPAKAYKASRGLK